MEEHKREMVYTSEFKRNLKIPAKKYRHIQEDIESIVCDLQAGKNTVLPIFSKVGKICLFIGFR